MSNPIKYSTGSESLALKKGNFYIGTGDVGKGPTSTTGFYNGITPPSGGYTIYLNKASGGPSIYTASNDAQLISLTNAIAGQSYTTANECLTYFAGQSDKLCVNRDYEGIVTDGLVLNLDAGFTPSYPKNGTTWYDVSVNTNNATLYNGPSFSGDSIVFDGVDDWGLILQNSSLNLSSNGGTIEAIYSILSQPPNNTAVISKRGTGDNNMPYHLGTPSNTTKVRCIVNDGSSFNSFDSISSLGVGNTAIVSITFTSTFRGIYINGILNNSQTTTITLSDNSSGLVIAANGNDGVPYSSWYNNIRLFSIKIYNRALSASEVLQNYNAQKGRFGL